MSKKNIFLLALGYLAGNAVASIYWKKKNAAKKVDFNSVIDDFVETHTNMIENLKKELATPENKKLFNTKKAEVIKILDSYKTKGNVLLRQLEKKGKTFANEYVKKLDALYKEKDKELSNLKEIAPEKIEDLKERLKITFEEIKLKMRELANK